MTIATGQTITASDLNAEEGEQRAALTSRAADRKRSFAINRHISGMDNSDAKALEATLTFTPDDDYELRLLLVAIPAAGTDDPTLTLALTAADGDDDYVLEHTLTVTANAKSASDVVERQSYDDVTDTRVMLHKGVRYKLALTSDSATAVPEATFALVARLWRRAR